MAITINIEGGGLRLISTERLDEETLYREIEELNFEITSAEAENIALFSCDEILKDTDGNMYFHPNYQIRTLTASINNAMEYDKNPSPLSVSKGLFLPIIEFDDEEEK